jgi:hypothetical protein
MLKIYRFKRKQIKLILKQDHNKHLHITSGGDESSTLCNTKHKAAELRNSYQRDGRMKKCNNIEINKEPTNFLSSNCGDSPSIRDIETYGIGCKERSLEWMLEGKDKILQGCPKNCRYYESMWKFRLRRVGNFALQKFKSLLSGIRWILTWFADLPAITQIFIIIFIVALVFSSQVAMGLLRITYLC